MKRFSIELKQETDDNENRTKIEIEFDDNDDNKCFVRIPFEMKGVTDDRALLIKVVQDKIDNFLDYNL